VLNQRGSFDIPNGITYLNAAYMGPLSREVVAAGRAGLERKVHPWTVKADDFFNEVEEVRALFARLVGADADGVAILPAVSYGVAIAAHNVSVSTGQRIVLLEEQFPSNVYSWLDLAEREGAEVATVVRPNGGDWTPAVLAQIDERCAVVAIEPCHWTDGSLIDLVAVGERVREVGAVLVVDGTQSIGAMPFDVAAVQPDFLITAVYKWLLAPYGAAIMWCAPKHRKGRPLERSWITRGGASNFSGLVDYTSEFREGARRYDVGETSDFAKIAAFKAALEQTLRWGVSEISDYTGRLNALVAERGEALGLSVAAALRAPHLMGLHLGGADLEAVADAMAEANVFVSVRGESMRVSPHVYNDESDVDALMKALEAAL
jgi:selenocysteine lyase/cysteine desulfurase